MATLFQGRCWKFGDNVVNDGGIMPLEYLKRQIYDPAELSAHCFETMRPEVGAKAKPGDLVVAGKRFGYGNAHIQGFLGLKGLGVGLLVESIPRGALRCAINAGVPVLPNCVGITARVNDGDELEVDFTSGVVTNCSQNWIMRFIPLPEELLAIVDAGGGIAYLQKKLSRTT